MSKMTIKHKDKNYEVDVSDYCVIEIKIYRGKIHDISKKENFKPEDVEIEKK